MKSNRIILFIVAGIILISGLSSCSSLSCSAYARPSDRVHSAKRMHNMNRGAVAIQSPFSGKYDYRLVQR